MEQTPVSIRGFLESIFNGFYDAADIIFFILFATSYVNVLSEKGALNALTGMLLRKLGDKDLLIIPAFMLLFGLGGTTFGMFEETYALIPAFIVIAIALGYDRVVGGAIVFVGVATGFAAATLNPFTIGIASAVAEVELVTPKLLAFRIVSFILFGAMLVGVARAVSIVMTDGNIIDTCVNALANVVSTLPQSVNAIGMVLVQNLVNFFIPSGSGQAVVTMPILAPVADLIGQSREVAVIAFQFGDGFSNMFWPTAVATECGIMGIGLNKWYKFITPLFGMIVLLQCILIVIAVAIGI